MKYALLFILGMTPLALLTAKRGWELSRWKDQVPAAAPPAAPKLPADIAGRSVALAEQWPPAARGLDSPAIFRGDVPPAAAPGADEDEWTAAWRKCSRAWALADAALPILRRPAGGDYPSLASALQDMEAFLAEHDGDFGSLEGGGPVRSLWKQRIARCQLAAAAAARDAGQYAECIVLCDKFLADHADAAEAGQAKGLKAGAAFCQAAARVRADLAEIGPPPPKLATARRIDRLKRRRNRISQFIDAQRQALQANENWIPAAARQEFADWEKEVEDFPAGLQRLEALAGAQRLEQRRREAQKLLDESQAAFEQRQFDKCRKLCDDLLADYPDVIAADAATVANRKRQSLFASATDRLRADLAAIGDPKPGDSAADRIAVLSRRKDRLQAFEDQYHHAMETSEPWITPTLRGEFTAWEKQFQEAQGKIAELEAEKAKEVLAARTREAEQFEEEYRIALGQGQYARCLELCAKLAPYSDVVAADKIGRARTLAKFFQSAQRLGAAATAAGAASKAPPSQEINRLNQRKPLLEKFVVQYQGAVDRGEGWVDAAVRAEFTRRKSELQALPGQVHALEAEWERFLNSGLSLGRDGKWAESIAAFSEAIRLNPASPRPYFNRGVARIKSNDFSAAISDLGEAIRLDPKNGKAYADRAFARQKVGDIQGANRDKAMASSLGETAP